MTNSYVQVPPDSTGKKLHAQQHTVSAQTVQVPVYHLGDGTTPTNIQSVDVQGAASVRFAEGQPIMSGFGALKTTGERALGVYESSLDTYESLFTTVLANGGLSSYDVSGSSQILSATTTNASRATITTNRYHYYLPGSSNIIKIAVATGDSGKTNNIRRWGAFDENDGIYFELSGTSINTVIRNSTSGAVVNTSISQTSWNIDKLNGTGLSGITLDTTDIVIYWMDYQWLGAGRVRFGIYAPDGSRVTCHVFHNNDVLPYMRTGTLPISFENINTGATGSSSELRAVGAGMYTEGTFEDYAFWRFADIDTTLTSVTTNVVAFSLRATPVINGRHNSTVTYPETLNVWCDQPVSVTMWQESDVTGGTWDALASALEINYTGAVNTSAAQRFKTLFFPTGAMSIDLDKFFEKNDEGIMVHADGTTESWSFLLTRLTASTTNATLNLGYKELW